MNICVEFEACSTLECDKYTEMSKKKRRQLKSRLGDGVSTRRGLEKPAGQRQSWRLESDGNAGRNMPQNQTKDKVGDLESDGNAGKRPQDRTKSFARVVTCWNPKFAIALKFSSM